MNKMPNIGDILTGVDVLSLYDNIQNHDFAEEDKLFKLIKINKEELYSASPNGCNSKNLKTFNEWLNSTDNYDFYHTDTIYEMIKLFKEAIELPPLIIDSKNGLYDGQHRLTAFSMIDSISDILVFKELEKN